MVCVGRGRATHRPIGQGMRRLLYPTGFEEVHAWTSLKICLFSCNSRRSTTVDLLLHTRLVLSGGKFLLKVASIKSVDAKKITNGKVTRVSCAGHVFTLGMAWRLRPLAQHSPPAPAQTFSPPFQSSHIYFPPPPPTPRPCRFPPFS